MFKGLGFSGLGPLDVPYASVYPTSIHLGPRVRTKSGPKYILFGYMDPRVCSSRLYSSALYMGGSSN